MPIPPLDPQNLGIDNDAVESQPRTLVVNITAADLKPGVPTAIAVMPQLGFRPRRLVVSDVYQDAILHGMVIGEQEQILGSSGGIPCAAFNPMSSPALALPDAGPGTPIVVTVSRPQGGPFSGALLGEAVTWPTKEEPLIEECTKALKEMGAQEE